MIATLRRLLLGSLRRQLTVGVAAVIAATMALFVWGLVVLQREVFLENQAMISDGLAQTLATSAQNALAARDLAGLQELVEAQRQFPELSFAMLLDNDGRVLAHTDPARRWEYVRDLPAKAEAATLARSAALVDVATPVLVDGRAIGWARVGLDHRAATAARLGRIERNGLAYALAAIVAGALVAAVMARRLTRRLRVIENVADAVQRGDLSRRAAIAGTDEAAHLGRAFDAMLDNLDISHRAQEDAGRSMQASLSKLDEAQRLAQVGSWELDLVSGELLWSDEIFRIFEIDPRAFGASYEAFLNAIHPEDRDRVNQAYRDSLVTREPYEIAHRLLMADGRVKWVNEHCLTIFDDRGKALRSTGTVQDVSARHLAEESLRKLSLAVEQSPASIVITNLDASIEYVNDSFVRNTGYSREEALGKNPRILKSGKTPAATYRSLWQALKAGQPWTGEFHNRRKDGKESTEFAVITPLRQADGRITHYVAVKEDITEKKRLGEELERYRRHLEDLVAERTAALEAAEEWSRLIVESSADGMFGMDCDGRFTFVNPTACRLLGHAAEDLLGRPAHATIHHSHADGTPYPEADCPMLRALRELRLIRVDEEVLWRSDGQPLPITYAAQPMQRGKDMTGLVVSFIDMTAQREVTAARAAALAEAERLARVRSEFLANMRHEIRTPLNAVLGLAQIGRRDAAGSPAGATFSRIADAGEHLLGVINDILDFSKIEAGKLQAERRPFALGAIIDGVTSFVAARAEAKDLTLTISPAPDLPQWVSGDSLRLAQILTNLLTNAIKFTAAGAVRLEVTRAGDDIFFRVMDTGIGMDEKQLARLFRPFEQADGSTTRSYGGTGLGLAISRDLARLMGGDIDVNSRPGAGSTFILHLPLPPAEVPTPRAERRSAGPGLSGLNVLAAEDIEVNRLVLEDLLVHEGAHVAFAENGRQALELLAHAGATAFDVVLMDVQMPVMDGYEATRRIRAIAPALPVVGLTAHALAEEREKCLAAGMAEVVTKPIDTPTLVAAIRRQMPAIEAGATIAEPAGPVAAETPAAATAAGGGAIDWPTLLARFGGRREFVAKLLASVREHHVDTPARLREAALAGDREALTFMAHGLKGASGNIEARTLLERAKACEAALRAGNDIATADVESLIAALEAVLIEQENTEKREGKI